jgi:hypothetical protein
LLSTGSLQSFVWGAFLSSALAKFLGTAAVSGGRWVRYESAAIEPAGVAPQLVPTTWWVGWAVLLADALAVTVLRFVTGPTDGFLWVQVVAALVLLACLPRPGVAKALFRRASGEAAER